MEQKLVGTALLAGLAAFLLDPGSASLVRGQLAPMLNTLATTAAAAGILCLVAIPILWLRPR